MGSSSTFPEGPDATALKGWDIVHRSTLRWLIALALVIGSTGGVSSIAMASQHEHLGNHHVVSKLYYPAVPHDAHIGDTGPWHASITIQSLENDPLYVWIMPDGRFDPDQALHEFQMLSSNESRTLTAEDLGIPEGQVSSVVVMAMFQSVWNDRHSASALANRQILGLLDKPKIAGTVKMSAPRPMSDGLWTSGSHESVDGYTAIPLNDAGWGELAVNCPSLNLNNCADVGGLDLNGVDGISYLPIAQTNSGWNTVLYVTNVEGAIDAESMVTVELIPTADSDNDASWVEEMRLTPGEIWAIDLSNEVGTGWIGSVRISSPAGTAAVAARHKVSTNMMLMNTSAPSRAGDTSYQLYAPLVFKDWVGWNTGISLSNESSNSNTIVVRFYDDEGEERAEASRTIPGGGHAFIYLPSEADEDDDEWYGTAVLESESGRPFHAAVDQVNYDTGAAMSYTLGAVGAVYTEVATGRQKLGLPLLQKGNSLNNSGDMSGILLFNPDPDESVQAELHAYSPGGVLIPIEIEDLPSIELGPRESQLVHMPDAVEVEIGTVASVVVTVTGGDGKIVAVSNVVNYNVQGDGAAVFSLSNGTGQFR
jgi:hypothetical protein